MKDRFGDILDQMQAGVYMTDVQTHEILFMNRKMKEDYGLENPEGKICWQVLQEGQTGPCSFCKIPSLSGERERIVCWRDHSAVAGKVFDRYDSLVPWQGGLVHMQQAYDVTNLLQLSEYATKDALCAVFNRSRGKAMLSERLAGLAGAHTCLIALLDVDNLKAVNDRYGHAEGDFLLRQTCAVLKGHLQGQDYLFRLSGDEFVLVMMDIPEKEAARLMRAWRREVEQLRAMHGKPYDFSFSFGVSSCGAKGVCRASELIARADERMYEEKLRRRKTVLLDRDENVFRTDKTAGRTMNYPTGMLYEALERSTDDYVYLCDMKTGVFRYSPAQVRQFDLPGEFVENLHVGDRVLLPFLEEAADGYVPGWGAYAEYCVVGDEKSAIRHGMGPGTKQWNEAYAAQTVIRPEDRVDAVGASMIITFREVLSAIRRFGFQPNETAVVFGAGPVGLCFTRFLKLLGLKTVITTDILEDKVETARRMGADYAFHSASCNVTEEVKRIFPDGVDYVVDAVGVNALINQAMGLVKYNGKICCYGISPELSMKLDWSSAPYNWTLQFVQWPSKREEGEAHSQIMAWINQGVLDPMDFISDVIPFERITDAFELIEAKKPDTKKIVVRF